LFLVYPVSQEQDYYSPAYFTLGIAVVCVVLLAVGVNWQLAFNTGDPSLLTACSSNFAHAGWVHLISNMTMFIVLGSVLEGFWRNWAYLALILLAGIAGAYAGLLFHSIPIRQYGASGMVYGLMGAYLVCYPKTKIGLGYLIWMFVFVRAGVARVPAWLLFSLYVGGDLWALSWRSGGHVAHYAHVVGFAVGILGAMVAKKYHLVAEDAGIEFISANTARAKPDLPRPPEIGQVAQGQSDSKVRIESARD